MTNAILWKAAASCTHSIRFAPNGASLTRASVWSACSLLPLWLLTATPALAQSPQYSIRLSWLTPGTEWTKLVTNGDFQAQGPLSGGRHPNPTGWTAVTGEMSADSGTNMVRADQGIVAKGYAITNGTVSLLQRTVILEPGTDYVLSAYMWNFGDDLNYVNAVVDFNDAPGEPQLVLYDTPGFSDQGYFVYRFFTTSVTGTNITLRVFYDGLTGTGLASQYFPLAAQWDNVAITKASYFALPQTNSLVTLSFSRTNVKNGVLTWPATE